MEAYIINGYRSAVGKAKKEAFGFIDQMTLQQI